jgi:hypothetical protein
LSICAAIKTNGARCGARAMSGSEWCWNHAPEHAEERRRHGSKGGRRGGRGRPQVEIARICDRLEVIAEGILAGEIERGRGAVAGQLLNYVLGGLKVGLQAREQEELEARIEQIETAIERQQNKKWGRSV